MSKIDKLLEKLLSKPKDFTYEELVKVLKYMEYEEVKKAKTGGSRRAFIRQSTKHIIRLHKPHPGNLLKKYQIDYIIEELKNQGLI